MSSAFQSSHSIVYHDSRALFLKLHLRVSPHDTANYPRGCCALGRSSRSSREIPKSRRVIRLTWSFMIHVFEAVTTWGEFEKCRERWERRPGSPSTKITAQARRPGTWGSVATRRRAVRGSRLHCGGFYQKNADKGTRRTYGHVLETGEKCVGLGMMRRKVFTCIATFYHRCLSLELQGGNGEPFNYTQVTFLSSHRVERIPLPC